jgi:5,5'-dehydrodivanillate O-demethylase
METKEINDRLTRVGPGTPMGELMRRYWWPIAATAELLENPVKAVTILGENLTLYRNRQGGLGLVGQRCAHRRFDLRFGIPEEDGLRCPYHGWMYDETGQCIEQPAEPEDSTFKDRVQIPAYPVEELGGLIFAYLGPAPAPLLPRWDLLTMENSIRSIAAVEVPCNWLQCMENSADPIHFEYLHDHLSAYVLERQGNFEASQARRDATRHHTQIGFERHQFGMIKRRFRQGDSEDEPDWKFGHLLVFPGFVRLGGGGSSSGSFQIRIPMDDYRTWHVSYDVFAPPGMKFPKQEVIPVYESPITDKEGNYILDYTLAQDMVGWWSQDTIVPREMEKLGQSDKGLILYRRMLKEQMDLVEDGGEPMNTFRDPAENQYLDLDLYQGTNTDTRRMRTGRQRNAGYTITGGGGASPRFNPYRDELEALLAQATPIED